MLPGLLRPLLGSRAERVAAGGLVLVAVGTAPPYLAVFASDATLASWAAMLASTGLVAALVARGSLRCQEWTRGFWVATGLGFLLGWGNALSCYAAYIQLTRHGTSSAFVDLGDVLFGGLFVGGGPGIAFGLTFAALLALTQSSRRRPGPEAVDQSLFTTGAWMTGTMVVFGAMTAYLPRFRLDVTPQGTFACSVLPAIVFWCGVTVAGVAALRVVLRRLWLRRVRAGRLPHWEVSALAEWNVEDLAGLAPLLTSPVPGAVLSRVVEGAGYRSARRRHPVALVPDN